MLIYRDFFSVFPAYAGVIPKGIGLADRGVSIPRVCGGDSKAIDELTLLFKYSPRMRG